MQLNFALLRGICQTPAYSAFHQGYFNEEGLDVSISIQPTAWLIPDRLGALATHFSVMPWTRAAASESGPSPLKVLAGSGYEEAAIVVRTGLEIDQVRRVAVPKEGGMKDLTAQGLLDSLGWTDVEQVRQPSGDGAILAFVGEGADAASMIEPYATMLEELGLARVVRRSGDVWPGVPGCCLTTSQKFLDSRPEIVEKVVRAFARGARFVAEQPDRAAETAAGYIGVHPRMIRKALASNQPNLDGVRNKEPMERVLRLMLRLGYITRTPTRYLDLRCLDGVKDEVALATARS